MFEFDKNKSRSNKVKHGIDFTMAMKLWNDPNRLEIPAQWVNESRYLLIAVLEEEYWSAVFTKRNNKIRIISVRKSRRYEKEIYNSY
ncbi:MAG: BrnT family toxin [Bacteroidales bacterium]